MSFRSIKIGLFIFMVFLKRQFRAFFASPLKPSKVKLITLLIIFLVGISLGLNWYFKDLIFHSTLSEGIIGVYKEGEYPPIIGNLLSRGLFKTDDTGRVAPDLAKSIESNAEGTLYTVRLNDNLNWSDSSALLAKDINFNFSGVEISYPDDKTIQFKLQEPFSPFPSLLTKPIYKTGSLIGVGPYHILKTQDVVQEGYLIKKLLLRSEDKTLSDLTLYMYPTENLAREALKLGVIQAILGINDPGSYQDQNILKFFAKTNLNQLVAVFYNTKDPILSDENFRLALSFAAPTISGEKEAKTSLPENYWAFNPAVKDYLDNPAQTKNYFAKVEHGKDQPVVLTTTANLAVVGEKVVSSWNAAGIKANLKIESGIPQNFQALLITQSLPAGSDQYALWHSTQTQTNISQVSSPRIDKDLEDGRRTTDMEKRKQIYQDFQKVLLDHAPATFLYFPKQNVVYNKKIEDQLMKIINLQLSQ